MVRTEGKGSNSRIKESRTRNREESKKVARVEKKPERRESRQPKPNTNSKTEFNTYLLICVALVIIGVILVFVGVFYPIWILYTMPAGIFLIGIGLVFLYVGSHPGSSGKVTPKSIEFQNPSSR